MAKLKLEKWIYRWRVRTGSFCVILIVVLAKPNIRFLLGSVGICSIGLLIRAWASGHLVKEKELAISGPYQYTRNPLYFGNLILGIGVAMGANSWAALVIFLAYFSLFYPFVIKREIERMKELFPEKYDEYKKRVPLFFPSFRHGSPSNSRFSWSLYMKNKEYRALLGTVLFGLLLMGKMLLFH
jgi:protein-S-isoprenylcysteine O-methyltransferase Ste14